MYLGYPSIFQNEWESRASEELINSLIHRKKAKRFTKSLFDELLIRKYMACLLIQLYICNFK